MTMLRIAPAGSGGGVHDDKPHNAANIHNCRRGLERDATRGRRGKGGTGNGIRRLPRLGHLRQQSVEIHSRRLPRDAALIV